MDGFGTKGSAQGSRRSKADLRQWLIFGDLFRYAHMPGFAVATNTKSILGSNPQQIRFRLKVATARRNEGWSRYCGVRDGNCRSTVAISRCG